jgi:acetylornithine deacetylase
MSVHTRIAKHVEANRQRHEQFLQDLLRIPKPRMQEHKAVHFAADALRRAGCEVEMFPGEGLGEPTPDGPPINILARRPGRGRGKSFLLEAHIDTVPPGLPERWTHDPWGGEIVDGRIYARGAHDDVAGVALICLAAASLDQLSLSTSGDVWILVTTEEEYSSGGMRALLKRHPDLGPDAHLLVDGNEERDLCIVAHPGSLSFTIRIPGPSGTAQEPQHLHLANPIEFSAQVFQSLRELEQQFVDEPRSPEFDWSKPTLAVVGIESVGWVSNVPEQCDIHCWGNVIPPMTLPQYRAKVEACVSQCASAAPWFRDHPPQVIWGLIDVPSMITSTDSPFFRALDAAHTESFGTKLRPRCIGGWGDMRLLGCPNAILYGPGEGKNYHHYDESYQLSDFHPMLRSLLYLIADWCDAL